MKLPVVLIGPMAAGKSTIARGLSARLGVQQVPMDAVRFYYYLAGGTFSFEHQASLTSFREVTSYWKPFEIDAVERVVAEFPDAVIDFGAGHAHYTHPMRIRRLQNVLAPLPNVFLLLPDLDPAICTTLCTSRDRARLGEAYESSREELVEGFVRSASFRLVAKHTVVTGGRDPDEAIEEVLSLLR